MERQEGFYGEWNMSLEKAIKKSILNWDAWERKLVQQYNTEMVIALARRRHPMCHQNSKSMVDSSSGTWSVTAWMRCSEVSLAFLRLCSADGLEPRAPGCNRVLVDEWTYRKGLWASERKVVFLSGKGFWVVICCEMGNGNGILELGTWKRDMAYGTSDIGNGTTAINGLGRLALRMIAR